MEWTDNLLQMAFLAGIIFTVTGIILYVFVPKKINSFYGYRTPSSMKSQERWIFAQKYSAARLSVAGLFLVVVSMLTLVVQMGETVQIIIQPGIILLSITYIFYTTEKALKTRFPKN